VNIFLNKPLFIDEFIDVWRIFNRSPEWGTLKKTKYRDDIYLRDPETSSG
jgi:hypothetical protein